MQEPFAPSQKDALLAIIYSFKTTLNTN
jgi:hypothetical protein